MATTATAIAVLTDPVLTEHAAAIRALGKRWVADVIEIGHRLAECRAILKEDGGWRAWLDSELKLSPQTAGRFIQVHELSRGCSKLEHCNLPVAAVYMIAAPSTPPEAREAVIERAQAGEAVSVAAVRQIIAATRQQPASKGRTIELPPKTIQRIKKLVERGMSREDIAATVGVTVGSLVVTCSRAGINLRPPKTTSPPPSKPKCGKATRDDIGPDSSGEIARLRARVEELQAEKRRLEIKMVGLESEITELRRPASEAANGEALDADAATLGNLLTNWDRASQPVRERFMARAELVRDPDTIPLNLDRRTKEARHG